MPDPTQTPEALRRLCKLLLQGRTGYRVLTEAAAAISALMAELARERQAHDDTVTERDASETARHRNAQMSAETIGAYTKMRISRDAAEAKLREIEAELDVWIKDPRMDYPRRQIRAIIARSTSQGGEG